MLEFLITYLPVVGLIVLTPIYLTTLFVNRFILKRKNTFYSLIVSIRYTLGIILALSGLEKLVGIPDIIGPHYLITKLAEYGLGLYGTFIAYSELGVGLLLLNKRLSTFGAVMAFPIWVNIFVVTVSLQWQGTPLQVAFFIVLNLVLLIWDWHKLKYIFMEPTQETRLIAPARIRKLSDPGKGLSTFIVLSSLLLTVVFFRASMITSVKMIGGALFLLIIIAGVLEQSGFMSSNNKT